ncbi:HAD hydrolase-like protein [Gracilimonas sp.]|uniref:HAD family hydrolase n=1 Tax=Gracilimonas sp. TaxID=1974203 RepID=UPI0025BA9C73|nr:HAD hydrolase-like protein [Gracilimonas sp.]
MAATHPWIILFDIDGTILTVNRNFNRKLLRELLDEHQINYPNMEKDAFSGRTDHDIFTSFLVNHDYDNGLYQKFKTAYLQRLKERLNEDLVERHGFVDEAIQYFSQDGFLKGLLTGNYPIAASYKLKAANINYEFSVGAFGEFDRDRNRLPFLAIEEVKKLMGIDPDPSRFVIIGDTPRDIICAKKAGMKCVAVTTGKFTHTDLSEQNPDLIIDSLAHPEEWFSKLTGS